MPIEILIPLLVVLGFGGVFVGWTFLSDRLENKDIVEEALKDSIQKETKKMQDAIKNRQEEKVRETYGDEVDEIEEYPDSYPYTITNIYSGGTAAMMTNTSFSGTSAFISFDRTLPQSQITGLPVQSPYDKSIINPVEKKRPVDIKDKKRAIHI